MTKARKRELKALWNRVDHAELLAVQAYLDWCRSVLGLPHWTIYVGDNGPCPDDAYADVDVNPSRWMAKVRLCRQWVSLTPWAQANALMHETLHVSLRILTEGTQVEIRNTLSGKQQRAFNVIEARADLMEERVVDQLATALTDSLEAVAAWERIRAATRGS